ncbi:hypothetical protein RQP46_006913 [Phenoliferia psychrophenolica]
MQFPQHSTKEPVPDVGRRVPREIEDEGASSADESGPLLESITLVPGEEGGLSTEILKLYDTQRATPAALNARQELIRTLTVILNEETFRWNHHHSSYAHPVLVEPFGSVRFGLSTSHSDLDLCIFDPYRPNGFDEKFFRSATDGGEALPSIYDMREIGKRLQRRGFKNVRSVPFAAVPIVKFTAELGGEVIEVDINTNERLGVLNSRLINAYCELHPLVRPLCVFIKFWAKQRELNDPGGQKGPVTFSSYTLILLVIAYLQTIEYLPNLQDPFLISSTATPRSRFWTRPRVSTRGAAKTRSIQSSTGYDVTFLEKIPANIQWTIAQDLDLAQLAKGFFRFFTTNIDPARQIVSIQHGALLDRVHPFVAIPDPPRKAPTDAKGSASAPAASPATVANVDAPPAAADDSTASTEPVSAEAVATESDEQVSPPEELSEIEQPVDELESEPAPAPTPPAPRERPAPTPPKPKKGVFGSRTSSPIGYEGFVEPASWTQKLVVQDPFLLTRNTAMNAEPWVVDELLTEMKRALNLIESGASIAEICASAKGEPGYKSLLQRRHQERKKRTNRDAKEKQKFDKVVKQADRPTKLEKTTGAVPAVAAAEESAMAKSGAEA